MLATCTTFYCTCTMSKAIYMYVCLWQTFAEVHQALPLEEQHLNTWGNSQWQQLTTEISKHKKIKCSPHVNSRLMQPDNQGGKSSSTFSKVVLLETPCWRCLMSCFTTGYWVRSPLAFLSSILITERSPTSAPVSLKTRTVLFCANVIFLRRSGFSAYSEKRQRNMGCIIVT